MSLGHLDQSRVLVPYSGHSIHLASGLDWCTLILCVYWLQNLEWSLLRGMKNGNTVLLEAPKTQPRCFSLHFHGIYPKTSGLHVSYYYIYICYFPSSKMQNSIDQLLLSEMESSTISLDHTVAQSQKVITLQQTWVKIQLTI